jgi:hypothetical protein
MVTAKASSEAAVAAFAFPPTVHFQRKHAQQNLSGDAALEE